MKKLKIYQYTFFLILTLIILFPNSIKALTAAATINCDKTNVTEGEHINCDLSISVSSGQLSSFQGNILLSENLELISTTSADIWTGDSGNGNFNLTANQAQVGNVDVASIKLKVKNNVSTAKESISVSNISLGDENSQMISLNSIEKNISILSNNANLKSLTVSNVTLSPSFLENVTEYRGTTTASSVEISVETSDGNAKVTGTGTKDLSIGDNTFTITVTAESGVKKNYTVIINREDTRSNDSSLKSLKVDNTNIDFKASQTEYRNIMLPSNISIFKVTAEANSNKARVNYSQQQIELGYDETATIYITVIAENGTTTRYEVTATRQDDRSKNNNLKSLSINNTNISLNSTGAYTFTVANEVTSVNIKAVAEDDKAKVEVNGGKNLKVGNNKVEVVVTAENNDIKTYTITVLRKNSEGELNNLSNNSNLKSLKIKDINFAFNKDILEYNLEVESYIENLDITYQVEDSKATAIINKPSELKAGLNKITILVTAENGNTSTYVLNVTRKEKKYDVENDENKIISALQNKKDYEQLKITVSSNESLVIPNKIVKEIISSKKKVTYVVKDNTKDIILYSFVLDGSLFDSYNGDINYSLNMSSEHQSFINTALENRENMIVNFAEDNAFPTGATFKIKVVDSLQGKNNLQLYTYDNTSNQLNLAQESINVEEGYITLPVQTIQEYVLTIPKENSDIGNMGSGNNSNQEEASYLAYGILGFGVVALVIVLIILLIKKKKLNSKKDNLTGKDNNVNESNHLESSPNVNMETINEPLANLNNVINDSPFIGTPSLLEESEVIELVDVDTFEPNVEMLLGISVMNAKDYLEKNPLSNLKNSGIQEGVVVVSLEPNSSLLPLGIKAGDVLLGLNGNKIANKETMRLLTSKLTKGTSITLTFYQNGENKTISMNI